MRILFDNLTNKSALSATDENLHYPVGNLKHPFIKKIFKSTANSSTVTVTFSADSSVDCCFLGFTNAASALLKLYSSTDVLLATENINTASSGNVFTRVSGVKYCTIGLSSTAPVYIGNIGIGESYTMPDPLSDMIPDFIDNSEQSISADGQVMTNNVKWLKLIEPDFFVSGFDEYNYIYSLFANVDRPIWVAPFEYTTGVINPFYAIVTFKAVKKDYKTFYFKVSIQEAR